MPIDQTFATYSDWCYGSAVGVYVLAMLFYLVEQAFGRRAGTAARRRAAVLVGSGAPVADEAADATATDAAADDEDTARSDRADRAGRAERFGRMAVALTVFGALLHLSALVLRGLATERAPWGNMYEFGATLSLAAVITWLVSVRRFPIRHLGVFVLLPVVLLMFLGGVVLYTDAAPVQPALQSYWLAIHVFAIALGSGMVLVPGVVSALYLIKVHRPGAVARLASRLPSSRVPARLAESPPRPGLLARLADRLPAAEVLDRVAYRTTIFAFPIYTAGVIFGAIWAESAWGRFWGWDPKETVAFIAWVVYAAYLHSRATAGWRGGRAAVINIVGFAVMVFNLFFINLVVAGLHSYANG